MILCLEAGFQMSLRRRLKRAIIILLLLVNKSCDHTSCYHLNMHLRKEGQLGLPSTNTSQVTPSPSGDRTGWAGWPTIRRIRIEELDEETRNNVTLVREQLRTDIPHLTAHISTGMHGFELSEEARKVLWYFRTGVTQEQFMEWAIDDGVDGEAVWKEIMSHTPYLEEAKDGQLRFKREVWVHGIPNFNWREKLSPAAQELYKPIASGRYKEPELKQLAWEKRIDYKRVIEEFKSYDGLYKIGPFGFVGPEIRLLEE